MRLQVAGVPVLELGLHEEEPPRALVAAHHLDGPLPILRSLVDMHARVEEDLHGVGVPLLAAALAPAEPPKRASVPDDGLVKNCRAIYEVPGTNAEIVAVTAVDKQYAYILRDGRITKCKRELLRPVSAGLES